MSRECEWCHGAIDEETEECPACEAERRRQMAYYAPLYRAGALDPVGPWRSRDDLIREAGQRDD